MSQTQYENLVMITTTTYGTWLPGDVRGYLADGRVLPPNPRISRLAKDRLQKDPVFFTESERDQIASLMRTAAEAFGYPLTDLTVEPWHLHWIASAGTDKVATMVGRLKNWLRRGLRPRENLDQKLLEHVPVR
jgi:hypothetical protein